MEGVLVAAAWILMIWLGWKFGKARLRRRLIREREMEKEQIRRNLADQRRRQELLDEVLREEGNRT